MKKTVTTTIDEDIQQKKLLVDIIKDYGDANYSYGKLAGTTDWSNIKDSSHKCSQLFDDILKIIYGE